MADPARQPSGRRTRGLQHTRQQQGGRGAECRDAHGVVSDWARELLQGVWAHLLDEAAQLRDLLAGEACGLLDAGTRSALAQHEAREGTGGYGQVPDRAHEGQAHLVDTGTSPITLNATLTGLKFFAYREAPAKHIA
jgi:hypothetical protein